MNPQPLGYEPREPRYSLNVSGLYQPPLPAESFKEQRLARESLGALGVLIGLLPLPAIFGEEGFARLVSGLLFGGLLFGLAQGVRSSVEHKLRGGRRSRTNGRLARPLNLPSAHRTVIPSL